MLEVDPEILRDQTNISDWINPVNNSTICSNLQEKTKGLKHTHTSSYNSVTPENAKIIIHSDINIGVQCPQISYEMERDNSSIILNNIESLVVVPPKENVMNMPIPDDPLIIMDCDSPTLSSCLNYIGYESRSSCREKERSVYSTNSDKNMNSHFTGSNKDTLSDHHEESVCSTKESDDLIPSKGFQANTSSSLKNNSDTDNDSNDENTSPSPNIIEVRNCLLFHYLRR